MNQRQVSCIKLKGQYLTNANKLGMPSRCTISLFGVVTLLMQGYQAPRAATPNEPFKINIFGNQLGIRFQALKKLPLRHLHRAPSFCFLHK